ncbi:sulfotransferase [Ekhidna sp.]|uniref:sulfotransferase n=1 Tax=Ekhidna sp. TaxID=2608089 RepID=UPI003B50E7CA
MKISKLIDQLYWISKFGKPIRKVSSEELFASPHIIEDPIFFLSTGRCGTEWFSHVISKKKNAIVFHNPTPNFSIQNKFIYELIQQGVDQSLVHQVSTQVYFTGREQHLRYAYKTDKRFIETNNHITFFAHALAKLFPSARFVHLYRHPGDFVTSGMNRGWFDHNKAATEKIIVPKDLSAWSDYSRVQKIGWVWNETNLFIEDFKNQHPERTFSYDFTRREFPALKELCKSLQLDFHDQKLKHWLNTKRNVQKEKHFPSHKNWNVADKEALKAICGELSKKYQYVL